MPVQPIRFDPTFPLEKLKPADYNPRRLSDDAFVRLQASLAKHGVIKPVILNGDGTLVAGHQRTRSLKALGETTVPALSLAAKVSLPDEVRFNLLHNSIETDDSPATITAALTPGTYQQVPATAIASHTENGSVVREISRLLNQYGPWGSVICAPDGTVIANNDYAAACKITGHDVLVYTLPPGNIPGVLADLSGDYGVYDYEALDIKPYNQMHCQMNRLRGDATKRRSRDLKSGLYEERVLPALKPGQRLADFGAGAGDYARRLAEAGWKTRPYEPHLRKTGGAEIDIRGVVAQIRALTAELRRGGLFDVVVTDSVLNSVTSLDFERRVIVTTNALTAANGVAYLSTRSLTHEQRKAKMGHSRGAGGRVLQFFDADNFSATFRDGVWTLQHFHTNAGLKQLLLRYFEDVETPRTETKSGLHAVCWRPRPLDPAELAEALDVEFNMEYPGMFRHNRHREVIETLQGLVAARDGTA